LERHPKASFSDKLGFRIVRLATFLVVVVVIRGVLLKASFLVRVVALFSRSYFLVASLSSFSYFESFAELDEVSWTFLVWIVS